MTFGEFKNNYNALDLVAVDKYLYYSCPFDTVGLESVVLDFQGDLRIGQFLLQQ